MEERYEEKETVGREKRDKDRREWKGREERGVRQEKEKDGGERKSDGRRKVRGGEKRGGSKE